MITKIITCKNRVLIKYQNGTDQISEYLFETTIIL